MSELDNIKDELIGKVDGINDFNSAIDAKNWAEADIPAYVIAKAIESGNFLNIRYDITGYVETALDTDIFYAIEKLADLVNAYGVYEDPIDVNEFVNEFIAEGLRKADNVLRNIDAAISQYFA